MFDALCEVRNIYQKNVIEIGVDVEQREEVEIPVDMVRILGIEVCMKCLYRDALLFSKSAQ